jgi:hypothetical protein
MGIETRWESKMNCRKPFKYQLPDDLLLVFLTIAMVMFLGLSPAVAQEKTDTPDVPKEQIEEYDQVKKAAQADKIENAVEGNKTGTDPRDFSSKWMPFYRYTTLENGLIQQDLTAQGVIPFNQKLGLFYELPLGQYRDFSDIPGVAQGTDGIGVGDMDLKFIYAGIPNVLLGTAFILPTATDDAFAGNALLFAPLAGFIFDTPFHGFIAAMNLYYFDVYKEDSAPKTSRYVAKVYLMQPLTKPGPPWGGLFLLPEFQPIYDFETEDFSSWIGVELGKMLAPGKIAYIKPGWGIDNSESTDRESTLEVGLRWFF